MNIFLEIISICCYIQLFVFWCLTLPFTVTSPTSPPDSLGPLSPTLTDDAEEDEGDKETFEVVMNKGVTGLGFLIEGGKASAKGDQPLTIKRMFRGIAINCIDFFVSIFCFSKDIFYFHNKTRKKIRYNVMKSVNEITDTCICIYNVFTCIYM